MTNGEYKIKNNIIFIVVLIFFLTGCVTSGQIPVMERESSEPGGSLNRKGNPSNLLGNAILIGNPLLSVNLVESSNMKPVDLSVEKGKILFLSVVPSIDSKVCEEQTHYLKLKIIGI